MEFVEAPVFTRYIGKYLPDDEYRQLQNELASSPEKGDVMPGTGGFRKLRWADSRRKKGRRGGLRVIYYYFREEQQIWLMTLYNKDEASDLAPAEKRQLQSALEAELQARRTMREKMSREKRP